MAEDVAAALPAVRAHIDTTISRDPARWTKWPGGWVGEISTALIDSIYSARAVYETEHGRGIKPLVHRWRATNPEALNDLRRLAEQIRTSGPQSWARKFGNSQNSPSRPAGAPGGPTKAAAILEAAEALGNLHPPINAADDITDATAPNAWNALRSAKGIGFATTNYFLMLLGRPGVKPDRMVKRFLRDATGRRWGDKSAEAIIEEAARIFGVEPHELDHAIWDHESKQAR